MSYKVEGLQETVNKLANFGKAGNLRVKQITKITAQSIARNAATNLSAYTDVDLDGQISQSINAYPVNNGLRWGVSVNKVPIAAYIEFGTGSFVEVAPEWKSIAWQFYVNGRGYTTPHPYLYPAYKQGISHYKLDIEKALEDLIRRTKKS